MTDLAWVLVGVLTVAAAGLYALLVLAMKTMDKLETECIRHFSNSLKDSGERAAAQARVRQLEADRALGKWTDD